MKMCNVFDAHVYGGQPGRIASFMIIAHIDRRVLDSRLLSPGPFRLTIFYIHVFLHSTIEIPQSLQAAFSLYTLYPTRGHKDSGRTD